MKANAFAALQAWTYQGKAPSVYTFFEAVALAGLEEQPIRLDSTTQRALLGFPVFGRRSITVHKAGTVSSVVKVALAEKAHCQGFSNKTSTWSVLGKKRWPIRNACSMFIRPR
ncbi:hypothetical protein [Collimonas sp.]|jgi:hypothetical protein|uniref:hypothetical protein n=1 Tax=Collimonas sp. TaxID=1963772 RepID=UPI0037C15C14